jgi:hypothetical protein
MNTSLRCELSFVPLANIYYIEDTQEIFMLIAIWLVEMLLLAVLLSLAAVFFYWDAFKKAEMESVARYYFGFGLFFTAFAINGFLDFLEEYSIHVRGQSSLFPNLDLLPAESSTFFLMIPILQFAFVVFAYQIESFVMNKPKKPFTIILGICLIISLTVFFGPLMNAEVQAIWIYVVNGTLLPFGIIVFFLGIFYLKIGIKSAGIVKSKALSVFFGLGFVMTGIIFDTIYRGYALGNGLEIWWYFPIICKIIAIIGVPLLFSGFRRAD